MNRSSAAAALALLLTPGAPPLSGTECPAAGASEPGGRARRGEASGAAVAFAASHAPPGAAAEAAASGRPSKAVPDAGPGAPQKRSRYDGYVDEEIFGKMAADGVAPAPPASDAEFLRRVTLDLTGRIPDADTVRSFLADGTADKRNRMVETLLASDAFVDRWTFFYDELLRNTAFADSGRLFPQGRNALHAYFQEAVRSHKPWDVMARELIGGAGNNVSAPEANFAVRNLQTNGPAQDTYDNLAADTGRVFLGMGSVFCTSCHDGAGHLDLINLWGSTVRRQDFWGLSAFYSRTTIRRVGTGNANTTWTVGERGSGNYNLDTTTGNKTDRTAAYYTTTPPGLTVVPPAYLKTPASPLGGGPLPGEGYRAALGRLVTSDPQFARAAVNRLWKELFTLGIVEPADGFDPMRQDPQSPPPGEWTVQPTHPALLSKLAEDFAGHGYDLRQILRVMATSKAYQLSSFYPGTWSEAWTPYFARHIPRRLTAEEVFDAVTTATGIPASIPVSGGAPSVSRALQLPDVVEPGGRSAVGNFLNTFLRGDRDTDARSNAFSISQALLLLNDVNVTSRIRATAPGSAVSRLIAANATPAEIVDSLFLSTLSRPPSGDEKTAALALFANPGAGQTKVSVAEDLQFSLLNKLDFVFDY
jgi:hypothetical protein